MTKKGDIVKVGANSPVGAAVLKAVSYRGRGAGGDELWEYEVVSAAGKQARGRRVEAPVGDVERFRVP